MIRYRVKDTVNGVTTVNRLFDDLREANELEYRLKRDAMEAGWRFTKNTLGRTYYRKGRASDERRCIEMITEEA